MAFLKNHTMRPGLVNAGHVMAGDTLSRPANLGQIEAGLTFYDQQIAKFIIWDGLEWVDAMGNSVDRPAEPAPVVETAAPAPVTEATQETPAAAQ